MYGCEPGSRSKRIDGSKFLAVFAHHRRDLPSEQPDISDAILKAHRSLGCKETENARTQRQPAAASSRLRVAGSDAASIAVQARASAPSKIARLASGLMPCAVNSG